MQKNTRNDLWSGKLFWENMVREGRLTSPGGVVIMADLLQRLGLQIRVVDVTIRVQKNALRIAEAG